MNLHVPEYYEHFCCTASACPDNCCIGWEIDIDPDSDQRYGQVSGTFGQRLHASIQREGETPCFRLAGERCAMLNDQNLCEIILHLGEEALCQICRDHPRFTETFGALRETGMGLCCPEAGRLLFSDPEPVRFLWKETLEEAQLDECEPERLQALLVAREGLLEVVQDRTLPLTERLCIVLKAAEREQTALEEAHWVTVAAAPNGGPEVAELTHSQVVRRMAEWLEELTALEPINEVWTAVLEAARRLLAQPEEIVWERWQQFCLAMEERVYEYEHLVVYILFRYFLKAVYTGDCLTPVQLAVVSCLLVGVLDLTRFEAQGTFTLADRIEIAGLYSKQMEYSEENLAALEELLIFDDRFSCRSMEAVLVTMGKRN